MNLNKILNKIFYKLIQNIISDPSNYLKAIIAKGIEWYDYHKLNQQLWVNYFNDTQDILKNEAFNNELNKYISELLKTAALETDTMDKVFHLRSGIVILESFKKRLEQIEDPRKATSTDDIYNPI